MKKICYKGKELETKHCVEISDEEFLKIRNEYYSKPEFDLVKKEFINLSRGGQRILILQIIM